MFQEDTENIVEVYWSGRVRMFIMICWTLVELMLEKKTHYI